MEIKADSTLKATWDSIIGCGKVSRMKNSISSHPLYMAGIEEEEMD
ncbi:MAG: hypothetical protein ACLRSW_12505 [Christensenellaceae bacterium]